MDQDNLAAQNLEAERAVLGAMLLDNSCLSDVLDTGLTPEAFHNPDHRVIFRAMSTIAADGGPVDLVTVREKLRTAGARDSAVSVIPLLGEAVPTTAGVAQYSQIVLGHYQHREAMRAGRGFLEDLEDGEHPDKALDHLINTLDGVAAQSSVWSLIDSKTLRSRDYSTNWILHGIIPTGLSLLIGKPGLGKSWFAQRLAKAVSEGIEFLSRPAAKIPVVLLDYENSAPVLGDRLTTMEADDILSPDPLVRPPPKIDAPGWDTFTRILPPESLVIVDSLRACQSGDENDSASMTTAMLKLLALRERGHAVLVLHHTPKSDAGSSRGSTAIPAAADHVLSLVRSGNGQPLDQDQDGHDGITRMKLIVTKTRFRSSISRLDLDHSWADGSFAISEDRDKDTLELVADIIKDLCDEGNPPTKTLLEGLLMDKLGLGRNRARRLISLGNGRLWTGGELGRNNGKVYQPAKWSN